MIRYALAGLLAVLMAGAAAADHKLNHNPGGGGGEPTAQPKLLAVRDADGTLMGTVTGVSDAFVNFAHEADPTLDDYFGTFPVIWLRAAHDGSDLTDTRFSIVSEVWFSDLDCKGTPYYRGSVIKRFNLPFLSGEEVVGGQIVYVPTDAAEPQIAAAVKSHLTDFYPYDCTNGGGTGDNDKIQATAVNFSFVPPYEVGF